MASKRHEIRRVRAASRKLSRLELSMTVCVLLGLLFVSFRVIGAPVAETQVRAAISTNAPTETVIAPPHG